MKKLINITLKVFIISFLVISCETKKTDLQITKKEDYQKYLSVNGNEKLDKIKMEIDFWQNKYNASPNQYPYLLSLSNLYTQKFEITGNIEDLYYAEKILLDCNTRVKGEKAGIHRSIAKNYISQHRFREALSYLEKAHDLGENKNGTEKMLFDVYMELGSYDLAKEKLSQIKDFKDFDYLIRLAKWNDHNGDLDNAISVMEKAKKMADDTKNKSLQEWIYSNIADFYGHAGRIQDSYAYYLKTLEIDNNNMYALKGIAWIAFSHERDTNKALEIIKHIEKNHNVPDLYLLKTEIYDYVSNTKAKKEALDKYFYALNNNNYGDMYNKYNALLYAEIPGDLNRAFEIANREIKNRPTPESYDLLAWTYYNMGEFQKAYEISAKYTMNKSHEPLILFHNELILKANKKLTNENSNKADLLSSIYELGPNLENQIKNI